MTIQLSAEEILDMIDMEKFLEDNWPEVLEEADEKQLKKLVAKGLLKAYSKNIGSDVFLLLNQSNQKYSEVNFSKQDLQKTLKFVLSMCYSENVISEEKADEIDKILNF